MNADGIQTSKARSTFVASLLLLSVLLVGFAPTAQAVGPNQNDLNSGGDLPDNTSVSITNYIFTSTYSGSGELDYGDDNDILRVALNANQGLSATLSFPATTTFANGTTVTNDFDLSFSDSQQAFMGMSWANNPETLSTNTSTTAHGGMVYIDIYRYSGAGTWNLTLTKFTVGSTGGGGNGTTSITNCTGAGTLTSDILEPNDVTSTASPASILPLSCTGLSIYNTGDTDYFEIQMIAGVTYYANITFNSVNGDIDTGWDTATGSFLDSSTSTSNLESMQVTALTNQTTYLDVYGWSGATNVYSIEITTDNPGGGQSFQSVDVSIVNTTHATLSFSGLTNGTTYGYNHTYGQVHLDADQFWGPSTSGNFTANGTTHTVNITVAATANESNFLVAASLFDASGAQLNSDLDSMYLEMVEIEATSSTTGDIDLTNLSIGTDYVVEWIVLDYVEFANNFTASNDVMMAVNVSMIDSDMWSLLPTTSSVSYQINWTGPTTMNDHLFFAYISENGTTVNLSDNDNLTGLHFEDFVPQLPSLVLSSYSSSSTASTNNVQAEGLDLVVGDGYQYQYRVTDASNANLASSSMTAFTATAQNMSMPTFTYATPSSSGVYCVHIDLYSNVSVQLIGDSDCFQLTFDDDNDGVANEADLCPNTATGAIVDQNGCALAQKDTDGDGYNDAVDVFPNDATQWSDMDSDGYGDNASGNNPDAFPADTTQWTDADGDGYGDNYFWENTTKADEENPGLFLTLREQRGDAFPEIASQWSDVDGDGWGDNLSSSNRVDNFPLRASQWNDFDGDGFGDNAVAGSYQPDACPK
ncbi:MAG: hypothetical protein QF531_02470, partial [Candidatus Poseidonia sp.]|nr:hypothetical protein [Poseidonia sp.]